MRSQARQRCQCHSCALSYKCETTKIAATSTHICFGAAAFFFFSSTALTFLRTELLDEWWTYDK